jgi:hypothetical protein
MSQPQGVGKESVAGEEEHVKTAPVSAAADTTKSNEPEIQDVPDPDEDDLDDLDGMCQWMKFQSKPQHAHYSHTL